MKPYIGEAEEWARMVKEVGEDNISPQCGHLLDWVDNTRKECPECECIVQLDS